MTRTSRIALFAAIATASPVMAGTFATITPDGDFSDWAGVPVLTADPSGDGDPIDFANIQIANDTANLYLRISYHTPVNPQNNASFANPFLAFDTDNNTATGFNVYGLGAVGSELGYQNDFPFDQRGGFNSGAVNGGAAAISPVDFGNPASVVTSQEYAIPRTGTYAADGTSIFPNSSFTLLIYGVGGASADVTATIPYSFAKQTIGWKLAGAGDWNVAANWTNGVVPNAAGALAQFNNGIDHASTVYSDTDVTAGTLEFDNANTYVLAGAGSLTLDGGTGSAAINVLSGSHKINLPTTLNTNTAATVAAGSTLTIADPLNLNGKTLTTSGTVNIISTVNSSTPASLVVNGGTLSSAMDLGANTSLSVNAGSAVLSGSQRIAGVSVASGASLQMSNVTATLVLKATSLNVLGTLNLADNGLIVNYTGASPLASVEAMIASGKIAATTTGSTALALVDANTIGSPATFMGEPVDSTSLLARLALKGDFNLDNTVNFTDLLTLAANYSLTGKTWVNGDATHDGTVNFSDLLALASNYGQTQTGTLAGDWALAQSLVPEPATVSAIVASGVLGLRRRRA
ncbi:MAG: hypothetical protein QM770_01700 [Tepidisphaeraceae bacterium]